MASTRDDELSPWQVEAGYALYRTRDFSALQREILRATPREQLEQTALFSLATMGTPREQRAAWAQAVAALPLGVSPNVLSKELQAEELGDDEEWEDEWLD